MLLDELSVYNSTNTTIISDNPKMQIYYKKNIKQKWNLDIDVNTTQTPKKVLNMQLYHLNLPKIE